jgi:hypothetical protein
VAPLILDNGLALQAPGGIFFQRGRFHDPGADRWAGTVDYGDGTGQQKLVVYPSGHFSFVHRYRKPGTYTVTVTIRDDDGGVGTATFQIVVPATPLNIFGLRF